MSHVTGTPAQARGRAKGGGRLAPDVVAAAKDSIVTHFGQCGTLLEACKRAGQTYSVAREWRDTDPAFAMALNAAEGVWLQVLEDKARQLAIEDSDPKVVMFLLKCIGRDKYGETRRIEHSGPGGGPIMIHSTDQVKAQLVAVAHQFPTVAPRLRAALQEILDALPKQE